MRQQILTMSYQGSVSIIPAYINLLHKRRLHAWDNHLVINSENFHHVGKKGSSNSSWPFRACVWTASSDVVVGSSYFSAETLGTQHLPRCAACGSVEDTGRWYVPMLKPSSKTMRTKMTLFVKNWIRYRNDTATVRDLREMLAPRRQWRSENGRGFEIRV